MQIIPKKLNESQDSHLKSPKETNTLQQNNQSISTTNTQTNIVNKYKPKTEISKTVIAKLP